MKIAITMPQLGLTMTEGTVSSWLKKPGDMVTKDEVLLSVSTDKVDMDVEATATGVLKDIVVEEGITVPVGTPLAHLETAEDESSVAAPTPASSPVPAREAAQEIIQNKPAASRDLERSASDGMAKAAGDHGHSQASPRARRRAKELGIDIGTVKGSGPGGRIVEEDLLKAASQGSVRPVSSESRRRQLIAERMVESITTIPHFSVSVEVNAEKLVASYESSRERFLRETKVKLTYTDLLLKALALALAGTPEMNCIWENGKVSQRNAVNVAFAVATTNGVVAPVLTDLDRLPIEQVGVRRSELAEKARQNKLTLSDMEGGVGTLSNLGMYRVDRFEGIITPGQSFILAVGRLRNRPWVETSLVIKPTLFLNLSVDHRVADGAIAASFLDRIAETIENPSQFLRDASRQ